MKNKTEPETRVNRAITANTVRLLDAEGEQLGIVSLDEALKSSRAAELDLVEVAPQAEPPVCRIMDFNKFKYEQKKATKEREKKQRENRMVIKEVQFRPNTDVHDVEIKTKRAREFLDKGNHVKFVVKFRGRELAYTDTGKELLDSVLEKIGEVTVDRPATMNGRAMTMQVSPAK